MMNYRLINVCIFFTDMLIHIIKKYVIIFVFRSHVIVFWRKNRIHPRDISNCYAESNGCKSITNIIDAHCYTIFNNLSTLDWLYNEYTAKTYTEKSMAPKETMGRIYKVLSKDKTQ